jgi:cell wall-associated protease
MKSSDYLMKTIGIKSLSTGIMVLSLFLSAGAQKINWQNMDLQKDSVFGISTEKAYAGLLQHKKPHPVVVAVIDGGVDTAHEDLRTVLWVNPKEVKGNGIDDDQDGYVDDVYGWDYIGGKKGDVNQDNLEVTRLVREQGPFYDSLGKLDSVPGKYKAGYLAYEKMKTDYERQVSDAERQVTIIRQFKEILDSIVGKMGKDTPVLTDFEGYVALNSRERWVKSVVERAMMDGASYAQFVRDAIDPPFNHFRDELAYHLNVEFDPRPIVGDDYDNPDQHDYGNNDVEGPDAEHGTHVAGIIGAVRKNGLGLDGVADDVQLMVLRVVPDGDERDKDVANGIRYAVDHGAKVINMSFGKPYSKNKQVVDEAVKYAMSKDVLLVHAAGNDGKDLDDSSNVDVPSPYYADHSGVAGAWITVGASAWTDDTSLVADFSNYGKTRVDVFAPGVRIYSSVPGSKYTWLDGTSMAAPVVTGLAALIREYYPKLKATDVKEIIMRSVVKPGHKVVIGKDDTRRVVDLADISVSGGIVNAYQALQMAEHFKR